MAQSGEGSREGDGSSLFQPRGYPPPPPDYIKEKAESLSWMEVEPNSFCYWSKPVAGDQNQQSPTDVPSDLLGSVAETPNADWVITEKVKTALCKFRWPFVLSWQTVMIQFWAPRRIESRSFLTVSQQPFAVGGPPEIPEGLWSYRKYCESFEYNVEEGQGTSSGPPGRVFSSKFLESSPDVSRYSYNEFRLRDVAVNCGVKSMITFPLLEPSSCGRCIGVLEVVSFTDSYSCCTDPSLMVRQLQVVHLTVLDTNCKLMEKNLEGQPHARVEIGEMLKMLKHTYKLPFAQTWGPCKCSNDMASGDYTDRNSYICHLICYHDLMTTANRKDLFHDICTNQPLRRGQGIVWKALQSHRPCFCSDISKLSMTEYPLAHHAYKYKLTRSFAISVRSSYTGDLDYVLEFFLPTRRPKNYRDDKTLLGSILATMKQHLTSFKVSSGKELGEELSADIVEVSTLTDELRSFSECRTVRSRSNLKNLNESVQSIEERIPESSRKDPSCDNRRMQDAAPALVTIKATYAGDIIKFQITSSSTMAELLENLIERLPSAGRNFRIKYKDDQGDWVLLACEKDLQYCLTSLGSFATIEMRVQ